MLINQLKKNKDKIIHDYNHNNFSSPFLVKEQIAKKSDNSRGKPPIIYIKDSNSSINIFKNNLNNLNKNNNLTSSRSRSIIRRRIDNKENIYIHEEYLTNNKEITSESNINININALPFTEREKYSKNIYFTIAPHINNMINLNKIKYMKRTSSRENIINTCNNDLKISKNIKNKINTKNNMVNKKNINFNKNKNIINKKKSNSFKSSYKNSNTQVSSSMGTAACSFGKNSHLMDFETIKVYQKHTYPYPYPILIKTKNISHKKKYINSSQRKFSLSPIKVESKELVKKMLLNNPISNVKHLKNKLNNNKKIPLYEYNKKHKNVVLPIRKEKDADIKLKEMMNLIINNKDISNNYGNISRNIKIKHPYKEKSIITISNKTNNSINTNESIKKSILSIKTSKNSSSNIKNKNKNIFPYNKAYHGHIKSSK